MKIVLRNLNRSTFVVWEMNRNVSQLDTWRTPSFIEDWCSVWDVQAAHNWIHLLPRSRHNSCTYGNLQHLCNQLDDEELSIGYFQQDGATSHTSHASMAEIQSFFGNRVISKGLWPPRSPDLTPPHYFLWGYLKGRVYQNKPRITDASKTNITEAIQAVTADVLARAFQNMARRFQSCLNANGGYFQHVMMSSHFLQVSPLRISLQYHH